MPSLWVFGHADSNGTGLRLYIQMFLSYGLYVCIILETADHRTTFGIFCNITQKTTPKENSQKMFHFSSPNILFSYGKLKDLFLDKDKFSSGRAKGRGKRGVWGKRAKMRCGFFLQNSHY